MTERTRVLDNFDVRPERPVLDDSKQVGFGHERSTIVGETDEWLTPPDLIEALGPFDLDPCAPVERPWPIAARHYTIEDDGLRQRWDGFVWLNPPYGRETWRWLTKLAKHGNGLALIFARTETRGFFAQAWERADALLFLHGRLAFWNVDGTEGAGATAPSVLLAYGAEAVDRLRNAALDGALVTRWERTGEGPQMRLETG